jgi:hypothetical protein
VIDQRHDELIENCCWMAELVVALLALLLDSSQPLTDFDWANSTGRQ